MLPDVLAELFEAKLDGLHQVVDEADRIIDDLLKGVADLVNYANNLHPDRAGDQHHTLEDELEDFLADC